MGMKIEFVSWSIITPALFPFPLRGRRVGEKLLFGNIIIVYSRHRKRAMNSTYTICQLVTAVPSLALNVYRLTITK